MVIRLKTELIQSVPSCLKGYEILSSRARTSKNTARVEANRPNRTIEDAVSTEDAISRNNIEMPESEKIY
jgi:hypothetical protein